MILDTCLNLCFYHNLAHVPLYAKTECSGQKVVPCPKSYPMEGMCHVHFALLGRTLGSVDRSIYHTVCFTLCILPESLARVLMKHMLQNVQTISYLQVTTYENQS